MLISDAWRGTYRREQRGCSRWLPQLDDRILTSSLVSPMHRSAGHLLLWISIDPGRRERGYSTSWRHQDLHRERKPCSRTFQGHRLMRFHAKRRRFRLEMSESMIVTQQQLFPSLLEWRGIEQSRYCLGIWTRFSSRLTDPIVDEVPGRNSKANIFRISLTLMSWWFLQISQGLSAQWYGDFIASLGSILDNEVM